MPKTLLGRLMVSAAIGTAALLAAGPGIALADSPARVASGDSGRGSAEWWRSSTDGDDKKDADKDHDGRGHDEGEDGKKDGDGRDDKDGRNHDKGKDDKDGRNHDKGKRDHDKKDCDKDRGHGWGKNDKDGRDHHKGKHDKDCDKKAKPKPKPQPKPQPKPTVVPKGSVDAGDGGSATGGNSALNIVGVSMLASALLGGLLLRRRRAYGSLV